ncbi:hypothetical protein KI387_008778, partial [Taxus chinensis]
GVEKVHVLEMNLVEMVVEISGVGVVICVIDANVGERINVRDVGIGVNINGVKIGAKDELNLVDLEIIEVDKLDGIIKFDADGV